MDQYLHYSSDSNSDFCRQDRHNFKKGASKAVSLWAVCVLLPQCVLFVAGLLCVFMLLCAVEPGLLRAAITTLELSSTVELSEAHYQRCLFENMSTSVLHVQMKRICFHLQWNCSWSEIRWFADSWQTEACSCHVPPQAATQFKFYFHLSALTCSHVYTCMKYNPAVQF